MNEATFEVRKASDLVVEENIRTAISPDALADLRASIERHGIMPRHPNSISTKRGITNTNGISTSTLITTRPQEV